ncbi:WXG100 family type VII secretion target [Corynebacterium pyruviciproducens]
MSGMLATESEVMVATAKKVDATNDQVQAELNRVKGIVQDVAGSWKGAASTSFAGLMARWDDSASRLRAALMDISTNIRSNASQFDSSEADNSQALRTIEAQGLAL